MTEQQPISNNQSRKYNYKKPNKPSGKVDTGRPTKYKPEYCTQIIDYFEKCQAEILIDVKFFQGNKINPISKILNPLANEDTEEELKTLNAASVKSIDQKLVMTRFPTLIRFSRSIGVSNTTLYLRAEEHKEFMKSLDECKKIQEAILLENGLQGTFNSQFAMFLLKNNHGYKDRQEIEHDGDINIGVVLLPNKKIADEGNVETAS